MPGMQKILSFKELTLKRSIRPFPKKNIMIFFFQKNSHVLSDNLREVITEERTTYIGNTYGLMLILNTSANNN